MKYLELAIAVLKALEQEENNIEKARTIIMAAIREDRLVHIFGTDARSSAMISEVFFRPGMPVHIDPMYDPTLDPAHGAYRNEMALKVDNLAPCILDYYERVQDGDPIILIGADEKMPMFEQSLVWAKQHGLKVIAIAASFAEADVSILTHADDNTFMIAVSAILNMLMNVPPEYAWSGSQTVDLEASREKIDRMLFRVRHL